VCGAAALAFAVWRVDWTGRHWQSGCAVAFSPDGRTVAAGSYSGTSFNEDLHHCIGDLCQTVTLFDAVTGSGDVLNRVHYPGALGGLPGILLGQHLAFSPDGATLAVGHRDGTVKLWSPATRQLMGSLDAQSPQVTAVAFSGDGRTLAASYRCWFTLWDTAAYGEGKRFDTAALTRSIAVAPDSALVAIGDTSFGGGAELWEVTSGRLRQAVPDFEYPVLALQFTPDGGALAIGGEKSALLWDLREGRVRLEVPAPGTVSLAMAPDGRTMATAGLNGVRFWDTATGQMRGEVSPTGGARAMAYSPDGGLLAIGDDYGGVSTWDVTTGSRLWTAGLSGRLRFDALSVVLGLIGVVLVSFAFLRAQGRARHHARQLTIR
jgi:WD40 repeat protein